VRETGQGLGTALVSACASPVPWGVTPAAVTSFYTRSPSVTSTFRLRQSEAEIRSELAIQSRHRRPFLCTVQLAPPSGVTLLWTAMLQRASGALTLVGRTSSIPARLDWTLMFFLMLRNECGSGPRRCMELASASAARDRCNLFLVPETALWSPLRGFVFSFFVVTTCCCLPSNRRA